MTKQSNLEDKIAEIKTKLGLEISHKDNPYRLVDALREIARWAVESCVPKEMKDVSSKTPILMAWNTCRDTMLSKAKELGILPVTEK